MEVPIGEITALSAGTEIHHRALLGVVPSRRLGVAQEHFVGLGWTDSNGAGVQVVFKLGSRQYEQFLSDLERLTGRKAIDTERVPTVVRYRL